jgi:hypothetical protein
MVCLKSVDFVHRFVGEALMNFDKVRAMLPNIAANRIKLAKIKSYA